MHCQLLRTSVAVEPSESRSHGIGVSYRAVTLAQAIAQYDARQNIVRNAMINCALSIGHTWVRALAYHQLIDDRSSERL